MVLGETRTYSFERITRAAGIDPYFVGKPNPLMMRSALNTLRAHSETTSMVGYRMDTDIVAGPGAAERPTAASSTRLPGTSTRRNTKPAPSGSRTSTAPARRT